MDIVADLHCHTIFSKHAYSTLGENIDAAQAAGLKALAITDHGIGMQDSPPLSHFENLASLPRKVGQLLLLRGVEANIMDSSGTLDMPAETLGKLDLVIASFHTACTTPETVEAHTNAYLRVAENPYVHMIGHSGTEEFRYDYDRVIPVFKQYGKVVEINAHTFICRQSSIENCKTIARLCKEYEVPVMVNSDAHSAFDIAQWEKALDMLESVEFPEELVINSRWDRLTAYFKRIGIADI